MKRRAFGNLAVVLVTAPLSLLAMDASTCHAGGSGGVTGIGVLGDSYSDEYQFYPPDRSTARNWVEILARTRGVNFGRYSLASRGEPRNQGFEFNWARSDATTTDLIKSGQHSGLAEQVARGEVNVVVIFIGGNDFIDALHSKGAATIAQPVLERASANFRIAVETILKASPRVHVMVATLPNILELPEFAGSCEQGQLSALLATTYTAAINCFNREVRTQALGNPRITLLDVALLSRLAPRLDHEHIRICGRTLDRAHPNNQPDHIFLGDSRHVGTIGQSVMANLVIQTLNARFGAQIKPLSVAEVLDLTKPPMQIVRRDAPVFPPGAHPRDDLGSIAQSSTSLDRSSHP
jgi:hypothetical protein